MCFLAAFAYADCLIQYFLRILRRIQPAGATIRLSLSETQQDYTRLFILRAIILLVIPMV